MAHCNEVVTITVDGEEREVDVHFRYDATPASYHAPEEEYVDVDECLWADTDETFTGADYDAHDEAILDALWTRIRALQNRGGR